MRKNKNSEELEQNQVHITLAVFLDSYNQNIPTGFPRASTAILRKFQDAHPALFKQDDQWSVARHRKKLMDWFSSHPELA